MADELVAQRTDAWASCLARAPHRCEKLSALNNMFMAAVGVRTYLCLHLSTALFMFYLLLYLFVCLFCQVISMFSRRWGSAEIAQPPPPVWVICTLAKFFPWILSTFSF